MKFQNTKYKEKILKVFRKTKRINLLRIDNQKGIQLQNSSIRINRTREQTITVLNRKLFLTLISVCTHIAKYVD